MVPYGLKTHTAGIQIYHHHAGHTSYLQADYPRSEKRFLSAYHAQRTGIFHLMLLSLQNRVRCIEKSATILAATILAEETSSFLPLPP